jgi:DNA modification methylase
MNKFEPNVESWEIGKIIPYALNSKKHPDNQIDKIAASMVEFGMDVPVVVDGDGVLIKGHGRRLAAIKLGLTHLPVIIRTDLSPAQVKAARIADNRISQSDWDVEFLEAELRQLEEMRFDLELTGFDQSELDAFLAEKTEGLTDPDDVPETPIKPVTMLGDVWVLGNHRIVCGDSTDADTVAKALNGVKPHLMVTDPPYGVDYDPSWRIGVKGAHNTKKNTAQGLVSNDDKADWRQAWALFPGEVAYVWHGEKQLIDMGEQLRDCGFETRNLIVWAKTRIVFGRGHYHSQHETCWYAVKKGKTGHWVGDRKQSTVWQFPNANAFGGDKEEGQSGHGTQKPVECMKRPIENNSSPGQAVYEPFSGSGTTIIAGEMTGRSVHAIELNPAYVDVTIKRWQDFTGKEAVLERDDKIFSDVSLERMGDLPVSSIVGENYAE